MNLLALVPLPYRLLALAIGAALLFATGWLKGNAHGTQKLYDYQAAEAKEAVRIAKAREVVTTKVVTKYVEKAAAAQVVTQTIEKEVVRYAETNAGSCLDLAWGRLHDAAAENRLPDPRPTVDGEGRAPQAYEALATVTDNYAACHRTADRLDALQEWVREQMKVR